MSKKISHVYICQDFVNVENHAYWQKLFRYELRLQETISRPDVCPSWIGLSGILVIYRNRKTLLKIIGNNPITSFKMYYVNKNHNLVALGGHYMNTLLHRVMISPVSGLRIVNIQRNYQKAKYKAT